MIWFHVVLGARKPTGGLRRTNKAINWGDKAHLLGTLGGDLGRSLGTVGGIVRRKMCLLSCGDGGPGRPAVAVM